MPVLEETELTELTELIAVLVTVPLPPPEPPLPPAPDWTTVFEVQAPSKANGTPTPRLRTSARFRIRQRPPTSEAPRHSAAITAYKGHAE